MCSKDQGFPVSLWRQRTHGHTSSREELPVCEENGQLYVLEDMANVAGKLPKVLCNRRICVILQGPCDQMDMLVHSLKDFGHRKGI